MLRPARQLCSSATAVAAEVAQLPLHNLSDALLLGTGNGHKHIRASPGSPRASAVQAPAAQFIKSSLALEQMPAAVKPEVALIGHSNVGKSSLVNMLTGHTRLARVSSQPGATRTINHFLVGSKLYLVDCPGYGYARVSKQDRRFWHELTQEYCVERTTLARVLLLVDTSAPPARIDVDAALWLRDQRVPFTLVFTKADGGGDRPPAGMQTSAAGLLPHPVFPLHVQHTVRAVCAALHPALASGRRQGQGLRPDGSAGAAMLPAPPYFLLTSSRTGLGRQELWSHIHRVARDFVMPITFR